MNCEKRKYSEMNKFYEMFHQSPLDTWFKEDVVAAIRDCSVATIRKDRWAGTGVPFIKCGKTVRYRKKDIVAWLEQHVSHQSTTQCLNRKGV